jgi:diguanylate cyclase (GGDEF)-like protein
MDIHPDTAFDAAGLDAGHGLFDGLPLPVCLVDSACRVIALNRNARSFWDVDPPAVFGQPAMEVLGIVPADGGGDAWRRLSPPGARPRLDCRITTRDGKVRAASIIYVPLEATVSSAAALFVIQGAMTDALLPDWALRDPVTGLGNRHLWEHEEPAWAARSGCIVFLDLDDLKEVNDLYGHVAGDRLLATAGQALAATSPPDALTVRYGGDEFVVLLPDVDEPAAEAWAQRTVRHVAASGTLGDLPIVPRLSHGVASFVPGGLRAAVQRADDVLYQRKGVLLPAASGGRIILTRAGRSAVRGPGDDRAQPRPGAFSSGFGGDFDAYLRAQFARAVEQAREFVAFAEPQPGSAVVEVGAGAGRLTFDGGLAERIGRHGQLLITDPSGAQLLAARKHAEERGLGWVRFLRAPAEDLPVASATADLVLGALFLQFTNPTDALREIARVVRPGGRVAVSAGLEVAWPPVWLDILTPVREELDRHGLPFQHVFPTETVLREHIRASGLQMERHRRPGPNYFDFPHMDIAVAFWRQNGLVPLLLRGVPPERHAQVQEAFDSRLRDAFIRTAPEERRIGAEFMDVVARKPG